MDPHLLFHSAMSSIMGQVLFAKQFDYDDEFMKFFPVYFHKTSKQISGFWGMVSHIFVQQNHYLQKLLFENIKFRYRINGL